MQYFVTGATGFIGRFLIARLLERRNSKVYVLMRRSSKEKFEALRERLGADEERLLPVWGDITEAGLVSKADRKKLAGHIDHVFH
ncbi:MAG: SDR family oxidoreductase, partial [Candidatus Acidiferrales bacterium]